MIIVENSSIEEKLSIEAIIRKSEEEEIEVAIEEGLTGKEIVKVTKDGREYYLNSIYGDELAECWCEQCELESYGTIVVLFGIANGEYIQKIKERNKEAIIILYEPSYSILYAAIECMGMDNIEEKTENVFLCAGKEGISGFYNALAALIGYENKKNVRLMVSPNYDLIYHDEYERFKEIYKQRMINIFVDKNTMNKLGKEYIQNIIENIPDYINQYGLSDLKEKFNGINLENIPAIIVAAGPSLDKNIKELRNAKGKAFIIAVDTALKSLAKENIIPDMSVVIDPHKKATLFNHEKINEVPLIYSLGASAEIRQIHKGMRIYQNTTNSILDRFIYKFGKKEAILESGGSVANDAFSLAEGLGFKTVIFIGLDLAYPDNKVHTENAYGQERKNYINTESSIYIDVEDIYGNIIKTEANMNLYREWFERAVEIYPHIKFIDATEGGARKKGMEILTLKEAIQRECNNDENIDFLEIISALKTYFNEEERDEIINYINNIHEEMEHLRKKMKEGIAAYDKLDEFNRRQKYTGKEFQSTMDKIGEINNMLSNSKEFEYLQLYVAEDEYAVKEELFDEKGNVYEDIKHMTESGKKLINSMINATYQIEKDMQTSAEKIKET